MAGILLVDEHLRDGGLTCSCSRGLKDLKSSPQGLLFFAEHSGNIFVM